MRTLVFAGLGSNVDPRRNIALALAALQDLFGTLAISRVVDTAPVDVAGGRFLNAVASFRSDLPPAELKALFCELEARSGRDRTRPDRGRRARTLDLDILFAVPPGAREVPSAAIPVEPYYRAATLEAVGLRGLSCPVACMTGLSDPAVPVPFGPGQVGDAPCWLHRDGAGRWVTGRAGRAALVTGGAVRLGREIALALARAGYDLALHYHSSGSAAQRTAAECRSLGVRCEAFQADLSDPACLPVLMADAVDRFPNLQLLVNSASAYEGGRIADTTVALLDRQWAVNFRAPFLLMGEFRRHVADGAAGHAAAGRGTIVNMIDNKVAFNQFHYAAYLTAKKALAEATRMAALEFAPSIRVNGLAPGVVMPAATRDPSYLEWRRDGIPCGHVGDPAHLCDALLFLAANDFVNGQILAVDGGEGVSMVGRNAYDFRQGADRPGTADATTADPTTADLATTEWTTA